MRSKGVRGTGRLLILASAAGLAGACADDGPGFQIVPADGFFEPTAVDFGVQRVGTATEREVRLVNNGGEPLALRSLDFEPRLDVFVVRAAGGSVRDRTLRAGERIDLTVVFGPAEAQAYASDLLLSTDDLQVVLPVTGEGRVVPPARFEGPASLSFGEPVELGRRATLAFGLSNVGGKPGRIVRAPPQGPFTIAGANDVPLRDLPDTEPGGRVALELRFRPTAAGPAMATLTLEAEDGTQYELRAEGIGVEPGNLACSPARVELGALPRGATARVFVDCAPVGGPYTLASIGFEQSAAFTLDNLSARPGGRVDRLTFDVGFEAAGLPGPRDDVVRIVAGHGAVLRVPVTATVTAPRPAALDVALNLTWAQDVDLDLHLVRADRAPYSVGEDCHWNASTVDWGAAGDPDDDPFLDQDARRGPGEEVISLATAVEGTYDVWVQYFDPNERDRSLAVGFDLAWSLDRGAVTGQRTGALASCGQMRRVGRIELGGTARFTPVDEASDAFASYTFRCAP